MKQRAIFVVLFISVSMVHRGDASCGVQASRQAAELCPSYPPHDFYKKEKSKSLFSRLYGWLCTKKKWVGAGALLFYLWYRATSKGDPPRSNRPPLLLRNDHQARIRPEEPPKVVVPKEDLCEQEEYDLITFKAAETLCDWIDGYYRWAFGESFCFFIYEGDEVEVLGEEPEKGDKLCRIKQVKELFFQHLDWVGTKAENRRETDWYTFTDKDDCTFIVPKSLLQFSQILDLKAKNASLFGKDAMKIDMCGLQLLFLLVASSPVIDSNGDEFRRDYWQGLLGLHKSCPIRRDYFYPHLSELVQKAHYYISDEEGLHDLYFSFARVYLDFHFDSTDYERKLFEQSMAPEIFHIFKWYIKRVYERKLFSLLISAQEEWNHSFWQGCVSDLYIDSLGLYDYQVFSRIDNLVKQGCESARHRPNKRKYRFYCRCMLDLYNGFHKTYERYCDELEEKPRVIVPNGILPVIYRASSLYYRGWHESKTVYKCDKGIDSYLEKEIPYKKGTRFKVKFYSCPGHYKNYDLERAYLAEKGPVNFEEFWAPRDYRNFENELKRQGIE